MADVFGNIGNEQVELNNAATEATLKLLLQSSLAANKQSIESINKIALRAGVDEATVTQTNQRIGAFGQAAMATGAAWAGLSVATTDLQKAFRGTLDMAKELTSGNAQASGVLNIMSKMGGPLGAVFSGMGMLASFQEKQLASYRELTSAGINFGGSLTDLRLAASSTYMTMEQFTKFGKENSESLAKLGTTTDEGTRAFTKVSNAFNSSKVGEQLRSLGFTSEQMNGELVKFMALQGRAGTQDSKRIQETQAATAGYLSELDALTKLTGVSKDKLDQEQKKAEANAAFQSKLLSLAPAEQAKLKAAYDKAAASGIKGATDLVISSALGLAPATKEAQLLAGVLPQAAAGFVDMTKTAMDSNSTQKDVTDKFATALDGAIQGTKGMEQVTGALAMSGSDVGGMLNSGLAAANKLRQQGLDSSEKIGEAYDKTIAEQNKQATSQADAAAKTETSLNQLGQSILDNLMPVVAAILPVFNSFAQALAGAVTWLMKSPIALGSLVTVTGLLVAGFTALKMIQAVNAARELARTGGRKLGTPGAPMIVQEIGGIGGRNNSKDTKPTTDNKPTDNKPKGTGMVSKVGSLAKGLAGGLGGVLGGFALGAASDYAKEKGMEKTGAGLDVGSSALTGAGTGAMIGSIVPVIGTAIGGALGGLAGGAYGLYQNFGTLFGGKGNDLPKPVSATNEAAAAEQSARAQAAEQAANKAVPPVTDAPQFLQSTEDLAEIMIKQVERLNIQTSEMVRYLKETAENTRRNVEATKQLSGNLFPTT
jgi:hypothetical protein